MDKSNQSNKLSGKNLVLGFQHVLAMFGATVLVPILTGLDPSLALLCAGIGTLLFHLITKKIVPVFLGSSFAFIGAIQLILKQHGTGVTKTGIIAAGLVYLIIALLIKIFGFQKLKSYFPPIVTGPIIVVIGLRLSPVALQMAGYNISSGAFDLQSLLVAGVVLITMILCAIFAKGFFKLIPILISVIIGYVFSAIIGIIDFSPVIDARWIGLTSNAWNNLTTMPVFSWTSILAIAPIAIVVFIEHIGDITTNGAVVGKDFFKNPGIHRTLSGDGLATVVAGFLGGPVNTTYSENTGVLAVTKMYNPFIIRIAAVIAILVSFIGKFGALIQSIPTAVMGGISIILFGMIASVGIRTLVDAKINFAHNRNLLICSLIVVSGIAINELSITSSLNISGLAIAAIVGIVVNKILPEER
ncbi:MAG: uracil-xanthine permease family protein [Candidatus Cloacimonetes bacterium]|nr:uracil-xanthine permease family protein [Candidatus Cloacimonadota bacterium]